jgi:hypothetical protein
VSPRAPPPASPYPLSAEAKPHLFSPPRKAAIGTPPPPLLLHVALTRLPATVWRCMSFWCQLREPSPNLCTASPHRLPAPMLGRAPSSPFQPRLSTSQSPAATGYHLETPLYPRPLPRPHGARRPLQPRICCSTVPSTTSSSRCRASLWAFAYGESLYSLMPKLGSPPHHLTLAPPPTIASATSSLATTEIDGRRRCAGGEKFPLFLPWAEKAKWAKPVSWARPSASVGQAHCNNACLLFFLLPFNLFKFNSN